MKYFKVWTGYDKFVSIEEDDLPRALAAQITGKVVTLKEGQIRGSSITVIEPDYHRAMGWNREYKLGPEDHAEISRTVGKQYIGYIPLVKENVIKALDQGDAKLLK